MSDAKLKKIGAILREARHEKGLTQREVAELAGVGSNRYAIIEGGKAKNVTVNTLRDIAKVLDIKHIDIIAP